jgi:hypothetical protein
LHNITHSISDSVSRVRITQYLPIVGLCPWGRLCSVMLCEASLQTRNSVSTCSAVEVHVPLALFSMLVYTSGLQRTRQCRRTGEVQLYTFSVYTCYLMHSTQSDSKKDTQDMTLFTAILMTQVIMEVLLWSYSRTVTLYIATERVTIHYSSV